MKLDALWYAANPGLATRLARMALAPLSLGYRVGVGAVGLSWSLGLRRPTRVEGARVVSVGNLCVGGAGKTPVVIFLARWAVACGRNVAVLTRGYGRRSSDVVDFAWGPPLPSVELVGDEPRLIARRAVGARVLVGADRVATAQRAIRGGADFLVLDDGFQHRRLARDVDVVVLGGEGNGHLLPAGPLREPRSALRRANVCWSGVSGAGLVALGTSEVKARTLCAGLVDAQGRGASLGSLSGARVFAVAGIARPERFEASLLEAGANVVGRRWFRDHHAFAGAELEAVSAEARGLDARLMTTEKDLERLPPGVEATALRVDLVVEHGLAELARATGLDASLVPSVAG